jgi:hypothetical protein
MTAVRQAGDGQPPGAPARGCQGQPENQLNGRSRRLKGSLGGDQLSDLASPEVAAVQTVGAVLSDLVEVAERLPVPPAQTETVAHILDRLSKEISEAAALLRQGQSEAARRPALAP